MKYYINMFDKVIVNLKNIIFFKSVMYVITIFVLLLLIPLVKDELLRSTQYKIKAEKSFSKVAMKLHFVKSAQHKLLEDNQRYQSMINIDNDSDCIERIELTKKLSKLSDKYHLNKPIDLTLVPSFVTEIDRSKGNKLRIKSYDVMLNFTVQDIATFMLLINDAYSMMPQDSIITSTEANILSTITPQIVNTLNVNQAPDLVNAKLNMRIRKISASTKY